MKKTMLCWVLPGIIVLLADQMIKTATEGMAKPLIPGVIGLRFTRNSGMALGLFQGGSMGILIVSVLLVFAAFFLLRGMKLSGLAPVALSMMAGGAVGNMIDRIVLGCVRDMFELLFMRFYIFNGADVGVVCGAVLCAVSLLFRPRDWSKRT